MYRQYAPLTLSAVGVAYSSCQKAPYYCSSLNSPWIVAPSNGLRASFEFHNPGFLRPYFCINHFSEPLHCECEVRNGSVEVSVTARASPRLS